MRVCRAMAFCLLLAAMPGVAGCGDPQTPADIWSSTGRSTGELIYPRAIDFDPATRTFVVIDRTARVQRFDRDGTFLNSWRTPEFQNGKPVGVSIGPDGNVWVPDTHYHRVLVYDTRGKLLREFGRRGTAPGEFELLSDIAFDDAGRIYVSEYGGNDRVQVFEPDGTFVRSIGRFGKGPGEFSRPQSLAVRGAELFSSTHAIIAFRSSRSTVN
jgi:iron(III) transport system ATP-binding protein